jgi:hypothetical protein
LLQNWQNGTVICFDCQLTYLKEDILKGNFITVQERARDLFMGLLKPEIIRFLSKKSNWNEKLTLICQYTKCDDKEIDANNSKDAFSMKDVVSNDMRLPDHFHLWKGNESTTFHWKCAFKEYERHFYIKKVIIN